MTQEEWRSLPEWPGYDVSTLGRVRRNGRIKATYAAHSGYRRVELFRDGIGYMRALHVLVAQAFHGDKPLGETVRFKNNDRSDCRADNLYYSRANCEGFTKLPSKGRMK